MNARPLRPLKILREKQVWPQETVELLGRELRQCVWACEELSAWSRRWQLERLTVGEDNGRSAHAHIVDIDRGRRASCRIARRYIALVVEAFDTLAALL